MIDRDRAPVGGVVSPLNKEFYEGGQFLPTQPLPKGGMHRIKRLLCDERNVSKVTVKTTGTKSCCWVWRVGGGYKTSLGKPEIAGTRDECLVFAEALIEELRRRDIRKGLMPHPTDLEIADGCSGK